ncbi:MAG: hypothetical protein U1F57_10630 [bacterium]
MKIQLMKVVIDDKNENNVLETKKDRLENTYGQALSLQSKEVKELKALLGVASLEGVNLKDADTFLRIFNNPQNPYSTPNDEENLLAEAREIAKKNGFTFDEGKASDLLKQAHKKEMEKNFSAAQRLAKEGLPSFSLSIFGAPRNSSIIPVKKLLQDAETHAEKAGENFDGNRAYEIRLQALATGIEMNFQKMEELAFFGIEKGAAQLNADILQYAQEGELSVDPERAQVLNKLNVLRQTEQNFKAALRIEASYRMFSRIVGWGYSTQDGWGPIKEGLPMEAQIKIVQYLTKAQTLTQSVGVDLKNLDFEILLTAAHALAFRGDVTFVEVGLAEAEQEAKKSGITIHPEQLEKIRLTALSHEFIHLNETLTELMDKGDVEGVQGKLDEIQALADLLQEKYGLEVGYGEEQMETFLKSTRENRLKASWEKIPTLARRFDLSELLETIKNIEAESKALGFSFDPKKVNAAMKPGLLLRVEDAYLDAENAWSETSCQEHLKQARQFAKDAGVKFDEARADAILKKTKARTKESEKETKELNEDFGFLPDFDLGYSSPSVRNRRIIIPIPRNPTD